MNNERDVDLYRTLDGKSTEELIEFIEQLQHAVDAADQLAQRRLDRIEKLERDREILRKRLAEATRLLRRYREHPAGRLTAKLLRTETSAEPPDATPEPSLALAQSGLDRSPDRLRVATILDGISDACWSPEFENIRLTRETWDQALQDAAPDVLFVESAFGGSDGSWARRIAHFGSPHPDLAALVAAARNNGVPTVFWNKEDPVNYEWFVAAASLFDHVFTVDSNQIDRYRSDIEHTRVLPLPFAAQPELHHPPDPAQHRVGSVGFAGTYYARKHAHRRERMEMLLGPALEHDLEIYDRMFGTDDPRFTWPPEFRPHVVGSVPYPEMGDVYRRHRAFINVNTVTDSPTMCARRIFELAACATPIVSDYAMALDYVPQGVVTVVNSAAEAAAVYSGLDEHPPAISHLGPEWIASGHTYGDRWRTITEQL